MKHHIVLLLLTLAPGILLLGCINEGTAAPQSACPEFVEPVIRADLQRYTLFMSSSPGIPFSPELRGVNASACGYRYRWTASDGLFLRWEPPTFQVQEEGAVVLRDYGPVYWTWRYEQMPGKNVTITLEVLDPAGARTLARTTREISWDGEYAVVQPNPYAGGGVQVLTPEK